MFPLHTLVEDSSLGLPERPGTIVYFYKLYANSTGTNFRVRDLRHLFHGMGPGLCQPDFPLKPTQNWPLSEVIYTKYKKNSSLSSIERSISHGIGFIHVVPTTFFSMFLDHPTSVL
jgi:hypothetical protein